MDSHPIMQFKCANRCIRFAKRTNKVRDKETEVVSTSSEKRKVFIRESEKKEKSNQFIHPV